jgi:hypothetical protein
MAGQVSGDGALSRTGWSVEGYNEVSFGLLLGSFVQPHPRFFVPCLLRLLKNRLPLAPDRPVAASVGRLLRAAGRASLRAEAVLATAFTPLALAVRLLHVAPVGLPFRCEPLPFETREGDPVDRVPLLVCDEARLPLCFPLFAALQRVLEAERVPFCIRVEPERESEALRAGRPLEADFAGLLELAGFRSWPFEWPFECPFEAGRLKCGRAEAEVPFVEGL